MNNFYESRAKGNRHKELAHAIIEKFFAEEFIELQDVPDGVSQTQRKGIDCFVLLAGGKITTVEVKVDFSDRHTIYVETLSSVEDNKLGWAVDPNKTNEWYLYMKPNLNEAFMVSKWAFDRMLRHHLQAWRDWAQDGKDPYKVIYAKNPGYRTECLVVPITTILEHLGTQIKIGWNSK